MFSNHVLVGLVTPLVVPCSLQGYVLKFVAAALMTPLLYGVRRYFMHDEAEAAAVCVTAAVVGVFSVTAIALLLLP